jgi:hypothetical protein
METIDAGSNVYTDDIAALDNPLLIRDTMDNLLIDRDTSTTGEATIAKERWDRTTAHDVVMYDLIQL